ncbi:hypothetical protein B7760_03680 [Burkholderia glumae]|nr:hypothetical protein B7760_03680 [Burkholderia glumae]
MLLKHQRVAQLYPQWNPQVRHRKRISVAQPASAWHSPPRK